jgi:hypothetical protein
MKLAMMFTTAALLATGVTAVFDVAFTFHTSTSLAPAHIMPLTCFTEQDGEGDEVEDIQIEPDDLNVFGDKCVKPDDEDDKIKSIKIDKAFLQKDSAVGDYCVSGYDDDDCEEDDHVFEYPYEQADVGKCLFLS